MDTMNFDFSAKNIPIANEKVILEMMIHAYEKFNRSITWRSWFKLHPNERPRSKETFDFKSIRAPPHVPELIPFRQALVKMLQKIKFRKRSNTFLSDLDKEIQKIAKQKDLIIPADKTTNNYLVPTKKYRTLIEKEIHKNYKKEDPKNVADVNKQHSKTVTDLDIDDRVFTTTPRNAFVTLKDHKSDFQTKPSVRLINPRKPEIGRIAMKLLDDMVKNIRHHTGLGQCTKTRDVIDWFESLENKQKLNFIIFDIESFYPSITPDLLDRAINWARNYVNITQQQVKIIHQASQSFLYNEGTPRVKKGEVNFDIGMGAYHGAQACEIVGLFLLAQLKNLPNFQAILEMMGWPLPPPQEDYRKN